MRTEVEIVCWAGPAVRTVRPGLRGSAAGAVRRTGRCVVHLVGMVAPAVGGGGVVVSVHPGGRIARRSAAATARGERLGAAVTRIRRAG